MEGSEHLRPAHEQVAGGEAWTLPVPLEQAAPAPGPTPPEPEQLCPELPDEEQARRELLERINAAAVTTLGRMAAGPIGDGGTGESNDHPEPDLYPWTDAVRWRPDEPDSETVEELFTRLPDAQLGSVDDMGWCGVLRHEDRPGGLVLLQNPYGRRSVWEADTNDELEEKWLQLQTEHEAYRYAMQFREEHVEDQPPRVWVGSLADYVAGHLHGAWLDATLDHEDLANAVQHVLRNSHEEAAEEYGIFDYDGFGHGLDGLLGEYPSLKTVSRIAQGVAEHGEAFAAWVAYVGPEQADQLDRFQDHFLGEYESMEAYVEEILSETGFYRELDEALQVIPEDLRTYVQVDVEGLARDWGFELHVVEGGSGGVLVFDPRC